MNRLVRLLLIGAAMIGFLSFLVADLGIKRAQGKEIWIEARPYDPRDPLLGYYSQLQTPLSVLEPDKLAGDDEIGCRGVVWVTLREGEGKLWEPVGMFASAPKLGDGEVAVRGRVYARGSRWRDCRFGRGLEERVETPPPASEEAAPASPPVDLEAAEPLAPAEPPAPVEPPAPFGPAPLFPVYNIERYYADAEQARKIDELAANGQVALILSVQRDGTAVVKGMAVDGAPSYEPLF